MKSSYQTSHTRVQTAFFILCAVSVTLSGCATSVKQDSGVEAAALSSAADLGDEFSLKSDRAALDEARKDIPEEVKKQNDEVALIMSYIIRDAEEEPTRLRDRFSTALRKRREANDKELNRARDAYSKNEKKLRETFLAKSKSEREDFLKTRKRTADDRKEFFSDQEDRRKAFFAELQEKRKDFEMSVQDRRKALEDNNRERQNAFNQEWRAYQARYTERKKQAELKKKMDEKSRALQRAGKPVIPVTQPGSVDGIPTYPPPTFGDSTVSPASSSAPAATSQQPVDPLAEFDLIPKSPGIQLKPGKPGP